MILKILKLGDGRCFLGPHPELDKIIQEILDDAMKHGVIDKLPERNKGLE